MKISYRHLVMYSLVPIAIVVFDQWLKWWVHTHMTVGSMGEIQLLGEWFKLHYVTNPGMAFGVKLGGVYSKLVLSLVRIAIMCAIGWFFYTHCENRSQPGFKPGFIVALGCILGGAMGNVIDGTFYGIWYENAPAGAPMRLFHGQVIDMLYLDIWQGYLSDKIPVLGGQYVFLWPIFNVADAAIFTGILLIVAWPSVFRPSAKTVEESESEPTINAPNIT